MKEHRLDKKMIASYLKHLTEEERAQATVEKYSRDLKMFYVWLKGQTVSKAAVAEWKEELTEKNYAAVTINAKLSALNGLFSFLGWNDCRVRFLRVQRRVFRGKEKNLTREEYTNLLDTAASLGKMRLALLLETICATGIRVSEVKYITVEAAQKGMAEISLKGKIRTILLPGKLCRKLQKYARKKYIRSGPIFKTTTGRTLSRTQIWHEMKLLCKKAGVEASKVFPHNLRHLFAREFYRITKDIVLLADVLGHSSVETTRIYLISTGVEHARQIERLRLVS